MQHHWAVEVLGLGEEFNERIEIMSVDWTDGDNSKVLEPGVVADGGFAHVAHAVIQLGHFAAARNKFGDILGALFKFRVAVAHAQSIKVAGQRALRLGDTHAVVIQNNKELAAQCACAIEAFHGETVDNAGVANERHNAASIWICSIKAIAVK